MTKKYDDFMERLRILCLENEILIDIEYESIAAVYDLDKTKNLSPIRHLQFEDHTDDDN